MTDEFERVRAEIRHLQKCMARVEEQVYSLQRQDPHGFLDLTGHRHEIESLEREIVRLRMKMPPYLVKRDGYYEQLPVERRVDPRELV